MRQDTAVAVSVHNNGAASLEGAISDDSLSLAACTFNSTSSNQFGSLLPNSEANTQPSNSDRTFSSYASRDRLSESDVIGRVFASIEEAETFYFDYAKSIGFSVRKNIMRTNVQGQVTIRRWVCSKEGKRSKKYLQLRDRKKTAKPLTRELCRAAFRIRFDHRKGVWVACEWVDTHTHVLVPAVQKHYEQQAATIYTRTVFNRVLKELREDGLLYISNCMSDVGRRIYVIKKFKLEDRSWRVVFHEADSKLVCTCHLMQSLGIPCSHSFTVMKAENLSEIPKCMILPRWTKNSKIAQSYLQYFSSKPSMNEAARIGSLTIACRNLIHFAAKSVDGYNDAIQVIHGLTLRAQDVLDIDAIPRASTKGRPVDIIKDPLIIKTKGSAKTTKASVKKRLCGTCQQPGHTKRTCIQNGGVKGNRDTDNGSFCTDFVSENTFNTTIATTTATLDMSTWGDDISIGTTSTKVDHNESFVLPVLNRCDGQSSNGFTFPSQDLSQNNRGGTIPPQWHEWWNYNVR
ncbi:hypothetical protein AB3S75_043342 [Citrus x aurantiifolia]